MWVWHLIYPNLKKMCHGHWGYRHCTKHVFDIFFTPIKHHKLCAVDWRFYEHFHEPRVLYSWLVEEVMDCRISRVFHEFDKPEKNSSVSLKSKSEFDKFNECLKVMDLQFSLLTHYFQLWFDQLWDPNLSDTSIGVFSLFNSRTLWVDHHAFPGSVRHGTLSNSIGLTMLRMDFASERGIMGIETPNNTPDTKTHSRQCGGHGKYCICSTRRLRSTSKDRDSRHRENQSIGADPEQKLREKQPGEENNQWILWSLISYVFHGVV